MSTWRTLFLLVLVSLSISISAASKRSPAPAAAPPPIYPLCADAAAAQSLQRAVTALDPERVPWLQTTFRREIHAEPLDFQVKGTWLAGPNRRYRIDMEARSAGAKRTLQLICDARTIWEMEQTGAKQRVRAQDVSASSKGTAADNTASADSLLGGGTGPFTVLKGLQQKVTFTRQDPLRWQGKDVVLLTGARTQAADGEWPAFHPRQCRLVLDAATGWPWRVEWWGPAPESAGDVRLILLEFGPPEFKPAVDETAFAVPKQWATLLDQDRRASEERRARSRGWGVDPSWRD